MRDTRRLQSRSEVRLDRVQVLWLTLGAIVALGVTFALGIVVGRRAARLDPPRQETLADIDAAGDQHEKLTFYDELTKANERPPAPRAAPTPKPAAPTGPKPEPAEPSAAKRATVAAETASDGDAAMRAGLAAGPARPGDFTVQVSAFQSLAEARTFAAKLERADFKPFIVRSEIAGKGTWFRVRLGRFATEAEAMQAKQFLARVEIPAWVLVTE